MNIEFKISKNPVNYKKALQLLEKRVNEVKMGGRELVWFLEHPTTYTGGIRSKKEETDHTDDTDLKIYQGISKRQFVRSFTVADNVEVRGAELKDGLLTIVCEKIIPEQKKKKLIPIS